MATATKPSASTMIRPSVDSDPARERALRRWAFKDAAEEDRATGEMESLVGGFSSSSARDLTAPKHERLWDQIETDDAAFYERYER